MIPIGLSSFTMGDVDATGAIGTALTALPDTVRGTVKFATTEPSQEKYYVNNKPRPVAALNNGDIVESLVFEFYDATPDTVARFFGGASTAGTPGTDGDLYEAHTTIPNIEQSFVATTENLTILSVVRGLLAPSIDWSVNDTGVFKAKVTVLILEPELADTPAWSYMGPTAAL
jgi:hypothetical protein